MFLLFHNHLGISHQFPLKFLTFLYDLGGLGLDSLEVCLGGWVCEAPRPGVVPRCPLLVSILSSSQDTPSSPLPQGSQSVWSWHPFPNGSLWAKTSPSIARWREGRPGHTSP